MSSSWSLQSSLEAVDAKISTRSPRRRARRARPTLDEGLVARRLKFVRHRDMCPGSLES